METHGKARFANESNLSLRWLEHILLWPILAKMYNLDYKMFFGWDVNFQDVRIYFQNFTEKIDFTKWWGIPFVTDNYLPQNLVHQVVDFVGPMTS